ncbi:MULTISPECIES: LLM class flavin-dependent oxidoreductase [Paenibacillus]|uniref:LLM class flavin-dependent oxidoreductase n=1 Tax=Paenibacillus TaxID=44249 RepID=UPI001915BF53|nr:LLM class flavin-dependent oxidoreductase [Paenibacillus sp. EPM92]
MHSEARQMHLGAFLYYVGHHLAAWRHPGAKSNGIMDLKFYKELAQTAERGKFDMIFLADNVVVPNDTAVSYTASVKPEPITLLSALSAVTEYIGLAATVTTTYTEPYHIARMFASLDHLSGGRAAWNVVTSAYSTEAYNFSKEKHPDHGLRYQRAKEYIDVVKSLWDSWEDDALVIDKESGIFADSSKIHAIDYEGEFFSVRGPLNVSRTPQGRPVIIQAGSSGAGKELAAQTAEVIFTAQQTREEAEAFYSSVKKQLIQYGRSADEVKIMPGVFPIIGSTLKEAKEKEAYLQELVHPMAGVGLLSDLMDHDLSVYPLDGPLPEFAETNGGKSRFDLLVNLAKKENLTIRELSLRIAGARGHRTLVGTPEMIADQLEEWYVNGAADGFNIMPPYLPGGLDEFVNTVIPVLQQRGLFRTEYAGRMLRDHLGLAKPQNKFSKSAVL